MIIGNKRLDVIHNIKQAANDRNFTAKTEIGDPMMTSEEKLALVDGFWQKQDQAKTKFDGAVGHKLLQLLTKTISGSTKVNGLGKLKGLPRGGTIVTANHFNQVDALAVNRLAQKAHRRMDIVIEDTNLKLPGFFSYIMNNMGSIPLTQSLNYLGREFIQHLNHSFNQGRWVLIFPEQEMWWNYRKPRKLQRGAYYFAAKCNVPVISTFVEIQDLPKLEKQNEHFYQTRYTVHVLDVLYPDPTKTASENASRLMEEDYKLKVQAYERVYKKKLDYDFTSWDIAGWRGE